MTATIERCILKGLIAGAVETRNMFVGEIDIVAPDTRFSVWNEYLTGIWTHIGGILSTAWQGKSIELQYQSGTTWITLEDSPITFNGGASGEYLPNLVAFVFVAKAIGNRLLGRKFFSPIAESVTSGNALIASALTDAALGASAWLLPYTTTAGSVLAPGLIGKDNNFHMFTSGHVSSLLGTIRRRKPGRGV